MDMSTNGASITEYKAAPKDVEAKQQADAIAYSVVSNLPATWYANRWFGRGGYENFLPGVGTYERQGYLGKFRYHPQNTLFQSAANGLIKEVCGTSWELDGKRRVDHFQNVLLNADRNRGWHSFLSKVIWDFLTLDDGAVIEVIGGGEPDTELKKELVVGVGHLDPCRCFFTDNAEFPVYYQDYYGKLHKMHASRVRRFVDMPLPFQEAFGRGFSAFSRAISWVLQSVTQQTYIGEMLNNEPPPGILNVGKVTNAKTFDDAYKLYDADRHTGGNSTYKPPMVYIQAGEGVEPASIEFVTFAQAPEGFNPIEFTKLQAQGICAALGIDPQSLFPLTGGMSGTGAQSKVLDRKAYGKALGFILKELERIFNHDVLPTHLELTFKHYDSDQSREEVERSKAQLEIAAQMQAIGIPREAIILYVANTVEAFKDVLLDENGQLRVYDDDPKDATQQQQVEVEAETQGTVADDNQSTVDESDPKTQTADDMQKAYTVKAYEDVRLRFVSNLEDTLTGANDKDFNRRRAGTIIRALIAKEGREAYKEGLKQGGVEIEVLTGDDLDAYNRLVVEASGYVSNLTEYVYDKGLTETQIKQRADMWSNVTLQKFYYWGIESGDKNGVYVWKLGATEEHCKDCARLSGQIHRFKDWRESQWLPGSQKLACNGYNCQCKLVKTKGRVRGKL